MRTKEEVNRFLMADMCDKAAGSRTWGYCIQSFDGNCNLKVKSYTQIVTKAVNQAIVETEQSATYYPRSEQTQRPKLVWIGKN